MDWVWDPLNGLCPTWCMMRAVVWQLNMCSENEKNHHCGCAWWTGGARSLMLYYFPWLLQLHPVAPRGRAPPQVLGQKDEGPLLIETVSLEVCVTYTVYLTTGFAFQNCQGIISAGVEDSLCLSVFSLAKLSNNMGRRYSQLITILFCL